MTTDSAAMRRDALRLLSNHVRLSDDDYAALNTAAVGSNAGFDRLCAAIFDEQQLGPIPDGAPSFTHSGSKKPAVAIVASDHRIALLLLPDELEAVLGDLKPAEQITALLTLMEQVPQRRGAFQRQLSEILVCNPGLLDPRVLIGLSSRQGLAVGSGREVVYLPVAHAIAASRYASFPRPSHGIPLQDLGRFAAAPAVLRGLTSASPHSPLVSFTWQSQGALDLAVDLTPNAPSAAARAPFFLSVLELARAFEQLKGKPLFAEGKHGALLSLENGAFQARVADCLWGLAVAGAAAPDALPGASTTCPVASVLQPGDREDFVHLVRQQLLPEPPGAALAQRPAGDPMSRRGGPLALRTDFRWRLAAGFDSAFFGRAEDQMLGLDSFGRRHLAMNPPLARIPGLVRAAARLLVDVGLSRDVREAAQYLADMAMGVARASATAVPVVQLDQAPHVGAFVNELLDLGATPVIDENKVRWAQEAGRWDPQRNPSNPMEMQQHSLWASVVDSCSRERSMQSVIDRVRAESTAANDLEAQSQLLSRSRRRGAL
jgi:hypothetical protein